MNALLNKLKNLESTIAADGKPFDLFALFTSEEDDSLWDLVISGFWIDEHEEEATEFLTQRLEEALTEDELKLICKVATLDTYDPRVRDIQKLIEIEHGLSPIDSYKFYGLYIEKIYVITCRLQVDKQLMLSMWTIIVHIWTSGNKGFDSKEILNQLNANGLSVRDYAMDRVLESLIKSKCINGPRYINSDAVREHGAMIITKVDPDCQAVKSLENMFGGSINEELAKLVADVIHNRWNPMLGSFSSEEIYKELITRGIQVPEGDMKVVFDTFIKAGVISGTRPINRDAFIQHGSIVITSVDLDLLNQLDFD
jgi:hypothetical protein